MDEMDQAVDQAFDALAMEHCVEDLRRLLHSSSFLECKTLLATFIKRIELNRRPSGVEYTVPDGDGLPATAEVLSGRRLGSPSRIRTYDPPVNSRLLYH